MRARKLTAELIADLDAAGYVIVPKEPSGAMMTAGAAEEVSHSWGGRGEFITAESAAAVYQAMIAAAPKQTEPST